MLRLSHPELIPLLAIIKHNVVGNRHGSIAGTELHYAIFRPNSYTAELGACYDERGEIYIPDDLVEYNERFADLIAYHEFVEIRHKRAGRAHDYAHRRALVEELVAASQTFIEPPTFWDYLRWRIGGYPERKVPDPESIVLQLGRLFAGERLRKGGLFSVIKQHNL